MAFENNTATHMITLEVVAGTCAYACRRALSDDEFLRMADERRMGRLASTRDMMDDIFWRERERRTRQ